MKTLFPYPTLFGDVALDVTVIEIDDVPRAGRVDHDSRTVDLSRVERASWETASVQVTVTAPPSEIDDFRGARAIVVANCGHSNHRISLPLEPDGANPAGWVGRLTLERNEWFGRAVLRAVVVAEVDGVPSRIIGTADEWTLTFDDLPKSPVSGSITIRWEDFSHPNDDARYLTQFALDPWYLRIDPENPVLFLNRSFDGLEALLNDRRRRPPAERALHDHTRASLATEVWISLFNTSLDAVEQDDDGALEWPPEEWQSAVLASLLTRMYEGAGRDDALLAAFNARRSPDGAATLHERLFPAASQHVKLPRLLRNGIRLLGSELPEEDE